MLLDMDNDQGQMGGMGGGSDMPADGGMPATDAPAEGASDAGVSQDI